MKNSTEQTGIQSELIEEVEDIFDEEYWEPCSPADSPCPNPSCECFSYSRCLLWD